MAKAKPKPTRKPEYKYPPIETMLLEVIQSADAFGKDVLRCKGIASGYNPTEAKENTLHRLRSLGGRVRFTVNAGTRFIRALTLVKQYVDEQD